MENHSANTCCSDKDAPIAPSSLASQECEIQIPEDELPRTNRQYSDVRHIHKVPQHHRLKGEDYYTPKFVSFGPYHHGSPQLSIAESFKSLAFQTLLSRSELTWDILYSEIFKVIDQVRNYYVGAEINIIGDKKKFTEIMLLDSCFFICLMKMYFSTSKQGRELNWLFSQNLGTSACSYVFQDIYLLENQIPLWVIKLLLGLIDNNNEEEGYYMLLRNFLSSAFGDCKLMNSVLDQPLHFLHACHMLLVRGSSESDTNEVEKPKEGQTKCLQLLCGRKNRQTAFGKDNRQFRSVTDLKAKGIFFMPSSYCLKDIKFESYLVFAVLRLPIFFFSDISKYFFSNMIAYESSPESFVGGEIICYLNFLKSLVVKPQDVRELREKKILFSSLGSDEHVFQVISEIDTFGVNYRSIFDEVKDKIEEHCSSKARTWTAEFFNTYFRSPWTFIALVTITLQLCLTIVQTYYAIHPAS